VKKDIQTLSVLFPLVFLLSLSACTAETYGNPLKDFTAKELVGVWEARYGEDRIDQITIREDGLYQQIYENKRTNYRFETGWHPLRLEKVSNGSILID
jgi:hypothetical protein